MKTNVRKNFILSPNGLEMADNFPTTQYESIYKIVSAKKAGHSSYEHFSGAWNALAYRYRAAVDHKDSFIDSIRENGSTPPPEIRYLQEKILFDFFSSSFSAFEALFYGLYAIGTFISPSRFSLSSERDQQGVSPSRTQKTYYEAFPNDIILDSFSNLFSDPAFQQIREIRNILTHRTAPGRRMYVSIGNDDAPATEWKLNNVPIDESITEKATQDLSRLLMNLLVASEEFAKRNIS